MWGRRAGGCGQAAHGLAAQAGLASAKRGPLSAVQAAIRRVGWAAARPLQRFAADGVPPGGDPMARREAAHASFRRGEWATLVGRRQDFSGAEQGVVETLAGASCWRLAPFVVGLCFMCQADVSACFVVANSCCVYAPHWRIIVSCFCCRSRNHDSSYAMMWLFFFATYCLKSNRRHK